MKRCPERANQMPPIHPWCVKCAIKSTSTIVFCWSTYSQYTRDYDHTSVNIAMRHTLSEVAVLSYLLSPIGGASSICKRNPISESAVFFTEVAKQRDVMLT